MQRHRRVPPSFTPIGFTNTGNLCYLIATLQGIVHHPRVAEYLRYHHIRRPSDIPKVAAHPAQGGLIHCLFCELYELLVRYWTRPLRDEKQTEVDSRIAKIEARFFGRPTQIFAEAAADGSSEFLYHPSITHGYARLIALTQDGERAQQDAQEFLVAIRGWMQWSEMEDRQVV